MGEEGHWQSGQNKVLEFQLQNVNDLGPSAARQVSSSHAADHTSTSSGDQQSNGSAHQAGSRNFEFVLVTDNESRRQVRRHAMRQYMHQRRLDSIARLGTARVPGGGWSTRSSLDFQPSASSSSTGGVKDDAQEDLTVKSEKASSPSSDEDKKTPEMPKSSSRLLIPKLHKVKREDASLRPATKPRASNPLVSPGEGVVRDPFSCYPIATSQADHELIQHFVVTYPTMMYKFADSIANNPMMEIFRQIALHDGLPFQAMLAIASKHRAGVEGKAESVQSLTHKMRALRFMNERIQGDATGQHDGTIYAVATMAVIEKWSKDASIERMHFRGLSSMIRNRGGMHGMRLTSPFLEKVLYWVDFSCAPKAIISTSLPWTGTIPDTTPPLDFLDPNLHLAVPHDATTPEDAESLCAQFRACEDFLRFFRRLRELEGLCLNSPYTVVPETFPRRKKHFRPGTQLYSILTMLPDYDHGIRDIRFIDEYTCMSCLFFLTFALYDCYLNSHNLDEYLDWLSLEVRNLNPFTNPSITSILWLFLNNGGYPKNRPGDAGDRCWIVSRMVRIAKRLEWKRHGTIWDRLRQVLIDFIVTQQECALGSDEIDAETHVARARKRLSYQTHSTDYFWNEVQMREDILELNLPSLTSTSTSIQDNNGLVHT
ncbi:hypothetical protein ASPACDRAFT_115669 [Aspergillus aculeatus ATCC 16872]|uniref:Transcription factor domain-containing protein n=1 Tax=Aspergillus aculeatus (strain ATCC 16872 / CBS 172.66 / WB 5094) TaxID=690307 RepID=A0A1L9X2H9_ASPA1|nr:uncharacterized protein ASPACDRAFT_115669 [Aspergillus aculeatus ATCC 16872]OJK02574.1 hypothetical protein ASPACDRAFT_115669 [Aspergillus aculeatus ATCC 16872]